jgi:metal-dependent hydrolase (beta-lactamase superfamily II)
LASLWASATSPTPFQALHRPLLRGESERYCGTCGTVRYSPAAELVVDPFHRDQGLAVKVKGKGLVVISRCSHAGIINMVRYAQKITGADKVRSILGGFHLTRRLFEPIIGVTIEEMKKIGPDLVVPMHCTGWKAINQFAQEISQIVSPVLH